MLKKESKRWEERKAWGCKIRRDRRAAEGSQESLASACGVHQSTVANWEAGASPIPISALLPIAQYFAGDPSWDALAAAISRVLQKSDRL